MKFAGAFGLESGFVEVHRLTSGDVVTIGSDFLWVVLNAWPLRPGWTGVRLFNLETGDLYESRTTDAWYMEKVEL